MKRIAYYGTWGRPGCITAVFVEHAATAEDILNALDAFPELKQRFRRRLPKPSDL